MFGRTGPPILGGRQFRHPLFSVTYFLHLTNDDNTHDYWLITYVQYCTVYGSVWWSGFRSELRLGAYRALQSTDSPPPVKHASLHNRLGVLKCSKTHLQQARISEVFRGTNPRSPATGSALEHNEQVRQLSNAGSVHKFGDGSFSAVSPRLSNPIPPALRRPYQSFSLL